MTTPESQAIAEIFAELRHEFLRPIGNRCQSSEEKPQHRRFVSEFQSAYKITICIQPFHSVRHIHHLGKGEYDRGTGL